MVTYGFLFVMSEPQLPVLHPKPHGLSHAKLLSTRLDIENCEVCHS